MKLPKFIQKIVSKFKPHQPWWKRILKTVIRSLKIALPVRSFSEGGKIQKFIGNWKLPAKGWSASGGKIGNWQKLVFISLGLVVLILATSALASLGFFSTDSLNKGLVGHWPMDGAHYNDDPTSYRVDDISGYSNHGTNSGATLTTDRYGQSNGAMSFVSSEGDYVSVANSSSMPFINTNPWSVGGWVRMTGSNSYYPFISKGTFTGVYYKGFTIHGVNGRIEGGDDIGNSFDQTNIFGKDLRDSMWHYIFITYDGFIFRGYLDSVAKNTLAWTYGIGDFSTTIKIGDFWSTNFLGSIQDVRIYNRALSTDEITRLYESYKPKLSTGTLNQKLVLDMPLRPTAEKVGSEMWDNAASTFESGIYHWQTWGITTINNVGNALEITYGDAQLGAYNYLSDIKDLNTNLTIGKRYRLTFDAKSVGGVATAYGHMEINPDPNPRTATLTNTMKTYTLDFNATTTTNNYFNIRGLSAGNVITVDNISLKPLHTADTTPNSNHGTIYGADIRNHGASFDGTNDYVENSNATSLPINANDKWTMSIWVYPKNGVTDGQTVFQWGDSNGQTTIGRKRGIFIDSAVAGSYTIHFSAHATSRDLPPNFDTGVNYTLNAWNHIVMTYNGSTINVYKDGVNIGTANITLVTSAQSYVQIAPPKVLAWQNYFNGQIADVLIYSRALSATEILNLYQGKEVSGSILDMPLSDKTGFKDISGNANHGTNSGAIIIGESGYFDGTNDYINCGNDSKLRPTTALTVSFWAKVNATKSDQFFVAYGNTGYLGWNFILSGTTLGMRVGNGTAATVPQTTLSPATDTWYHIMGTYDNATVRLYVNGIYKSNAGLTGPINYTGLTACYIGNAEGLNSIRYFNGQISDVQIYNRVLSNGGVSVGQTAGGEIASLYAKGRSGSSVGMTTGSLNKGLILDMPLKSTAEKVGSELVTNGNFVVDTSGWIIQQTGGSGTLTRDALTPIEGSYDANAVVDGGTNRPAILSNSISFSSGKTYRARFAYRRNVDKLMYLKFPKGDASSYSPLGGTAGPLLSATVGGITIYTQTFTATETANARFCIFGGVADSFDFDIANISIKELQTADTTPNSNHGTIYGAATYATHTTFDGIDDYISITDNSVLDITGDLTIGAWVKPQNITEAGRRIVVKAVTGSAYSVNYQFLVTYDDIDAWYGDGTNYRGETTNTSLLSPDTWSYITAAFIGSDIKLYINGEEQTTDITETGATTKQTNDYPLAIGALHNGAYEFNGSISNLKIYNRALSKNEITSLFDKERSQFGI